MRGRSWPKSRVAVKAGVPGFMAALCLHKKQKQACKRVIYQRFWGGRRDQNVPHCPEYPAGSAGYITLSIMKTPQEKKRLSYAKDRRNTYGENSKASRKNVPRSKALDIRSERHAQEVLMSKALHGGDEQLSAIEVKVRTTKPRQWRKSPDTPLGELLARKRAIHG
jgi:hypothetical protein